MSSVRSQIVGVGHYLPEKILTNNDLSNLVDTSDEWIYSRTGIKKRHFAKNEELTSDLATKAARNAIKNANISSDEIDLIVLATTTPDLTFPATATKVQDNLKIKNCYAYDVSAVCCGYLLALQSANNAIKNGDAKTALVIGAETLSRIMDMNDRNTCVLFGDGAGAVVLQENKDNNNSGIIDIKLESDGSFYDSLKTTGGPSINNSQSYIYMNGKEVFRQAVKCLFNSANDMLKKHNLSHHDLDWLISHQANVRIIDYVSKKLEIDEKKVIKTVENHANTSAASIPLALSQALEEDKIKKGDLILHEAIGGGLIWGSALLRW